MKKFFLSILILLASIQICQAFPEYLDGDRNYPAIDGHMGTGYFMDKNSIYVEMEVPPVYVLQVSCLCVADPDVSKVSDATILKFRIRYVDEKTPQMYMEGLNDEWIYVKPFGSYAESGVILPIGEAAFYTKFGRKFYGREPMYNDFFKENSEVFGEKFYERVRG